MEKLNIESLKPLKRKVESFYEDSYILTDDYECAYCASELDPVELLLRKYRMAACINLLQEFPRKVHLGEIYLPDIEKMFFNYDRDDGYYRYESDGWISYLEKTISEYIEFGELYLERCLKNTGWKLYFISEMDEYIGFSKTQIEHMRESIEAHWKAANDDQISKRTTEYLKSAGLSNEGYDDFYPIYNLVLINEKISKVFSICKNSKGHKEWEEYQELLSVSRFYLLDRYFPFFCSKDINESEGVCINYMIGEIYSDRAEESGLYQLNYEAVLLLMLADMYADLFLERYESKVGDMK